MKAYHSAHERRLRKPAFAFVVVAIGRGRVSVDHKDIDGFSTLHINRSFLLYGALPDAIMRQAYYVRHSGRTYP
jgi:hypothetical protein